MSIIGNLENTEKQRKKVSQSQSQLPKNSYFQYFWSISCTQLSTSHLSLTSYYSYEDFFVLCGSQQDF